LYGVVEVVLAFEVKNLPKHFDELTHELVAQRAGIDVGRDS